VLAGCNLSVDKPSDSTATSGGGTGSGTGSAQYSVGGSISGLAQSGLMLASGTNSVSVVAGATSFTLPSLLAAGATYTVTVMTQPTGQTCAARNDSGTISNANVTSVQVTCTTNTYPIGGLITGLNAGGLVVANGADTLSVSAGASAYMMPTRQPMGATYDVTVQTQPTGLSCQVVNASGTMPAAAVSTVNIVCGQWTWIDGANATGSAGNSGMQGVAASANAPAARSGEVRWSASGRLWVFGGIGSTGSRSDLWRFDPGTSEWTWIAGTSALNAAGVYGTRGMQAAGNAPGARQGATGWVDAGGNLWLFGGQGYDAGGTSGWLDDLWEYDVTTGDWKWVAGESSAYASGAAAPAGEPDARSGAVGWTDASGNLWLFGGTGTGATGSGVTNDLWEYVIGGAGWMSVNGSQTPGQNGVYVGTMSTPALPGSRTQASSFVDSAGHLWLFGGQGYGAVGGIGLLNDLWSFAPGSATWTFVGGFDTVNGAGVYGSKSTTAKNWPGARDAASASSDTSGNLWLFGGTGYDVNGMQGALGDFWEYQLSTGSWIWMGGSQTRANLTDYGTQGVGAVGNAPGARAGAAAWIDASGDAWLFGGQGLANTSAAGPLNDLWQFVP
jgi:N-acetylneuraminic acid mutarotase